MHFLFIVVLKTWKQQIPYLNNDEQTKHLRFKAWYLKLKHVKHYHIAWSMDQKHGKLKKQTKPNKKNIKNKTKLKKLKEHKKKS